MTNRAKSLVGVADRLTSAFRMARVLEMAIDGAPIDSGVKDTLDHLGAQHSDALQELSDNVEKMLEEKGDNP